MRCIIGLIVLWSLFAAACDDSSGGDSPAATPAVASVPASLELDAFYEKYLDADGIPVVASGKVQDEALLEARVIVQGLLQDSPIRAAMISSGAYVGIMAETEVTTDIPEHAYLSDDPSTDWDERARGLGGVQGNPITTGAEENVLCRSSDRYLGESILVHEFAHALLNLGVANTSDGSDFLNRLMRAFDAALGEGKWMETYAATSVDEYWAEGVQSWFDTNLAADPPDGVHNHVNTRSELQSYDPALANLIDETFATNWRYSCPDRAQ